LPGWLKLLGASLDGLAKALLWLAMLVLALTFLLMNVEIAARSALGRSTLIADEYAGYGFATIVLAAMLHAHRRGALLRVGWVERWSLPVARRVMLATAAMLSTVLAAFSAYAGFRLWSLSWRFDSTSAFASETPLWLPQLAVPIGFALRALSFAEEALRRLLGDRG
jgi:C4-dicarboxylate transporter DctQ subunit